ncbi:MAG: EpsG family protein [Clostridia bacterium]|nr:EpsG family protein [Clostridia bacterium]
MTKLWILLSVCLVIARIIESRDRRMNRYGTHRREHLFTFLLVIILGFFCGLRIWGNDTGTYLEIYHHLTPTLDQLSPESLWDFSSGIALTYFFSLFKTLGFSSQDMLMTFAFATSILYVRFVRNYSLSFVFGVFLMFTTGFYTFSLAAIKQCMATGFCLLAVSAAIERKWVRYVLFVLTASLFHPYAIIYFVVPLMFFRPWTNLSYIYIVVFFFAGLYLETLIGTVIDITDMMGADYTADELMGAGVNIFRVLVSFVPLILSFLYRKRLFAASDRTENLMMNLAMLNALIMFVGLFGTANYFARLANYFLPAQIIVLPWILQRLPRRDRVLFYPASVVGYLGYFYYENAIIRPFDTGYSHMSLWNYLANLFTGGLS